MNIKSEDRFPWKSFRKIMRAKLNQGNGKWIRKERRIHKVKKEPLVKYYN